MRSLGKPLSLSGPCRQRAKSTKQLLALLAICSCALPAQAQYGGGTGGANDPYLIYTAEQMNQIGANPGDWTKHFKLMADIDLSEYAGAAFNIIGTAALESFNGVFDGNGHTISNFSSTSTREWNVGLFGYVTGQIKALGLISPNIFAQGWNVGSLAGYVDQGTITGCYAKGASVSGNSTIGGLVGSNSGRIVDCYSSGSVFGDAYVGGLVGQVGEGTVTKCYSKASVSGNRNVGGLVGKTAKETSAVTDCYATGVVKGGVYVGGLVGQIERGAAYRCYSTGSVSGDQYVGGFTGYVRVLGLAMHCFWDTQTSGQTTSAGGTGKTTAEMQAISTYVGWDFRDIWEICAGMNYPVLRWQIPVVDFLCPDGVSFVDFAFFAERWLDKACNAANGYCQGTDLNRSGAVDISDLGIFVEHWLEGIP
ncbi:MAG: hypothetical protein AMJ75_11735 [Phycisphaerae bacterium SM1_79]|nr:MAG: hypothetical protein AMJ75_11735 [Phycisphaerae bacterium SM1_79]